MTKYIKILILPFLVLLAQCAFCNSTSSGWQEYIETIEKSFSFQTDRPSIGVDNFYGDITIVSSERSDAQVEITITVEARNKSKADEIFKRIEIDLDNDSRSLKATTRFQKGLKNRRFKKHEKYKIDYKILLPMKSTLSLYNKYGDISLSNHNNDVEITLKYGSGSLQDIKGDLDLDLSYSDRFTIGTIDGDIDAKISYSSINIDRVQSVECRSSYSDLTFEYVVDIECDAKYDEYTILNASNVDITDKYSNVTLGQVQSIHLDMGYSSIKIKELSKQGIFDTAFGNVDIKNVQAEAEKILIDAKYTGYKIGCTGGLSLDIDTKYTNVKYPSDLNISYRDKDNNALKIKGTKEGIGSLNITATMKYGSLKIRS